MKKRGFVRTLTFISVFMLFFAQSAYDPAVHARMQKMEDEHLASVDAAALNLDLRLTARAVAGDGYSPGLTLSEAGGAGDSINIGYMVLGNGLTNAGTFSTNTTMSWDIGALTSTGQRWLMGTNVTFPSSAGMGLIANDIYYRDGGGTARYIGNAIISGLYFGRAMTSVSPNLSPSFTSGLTAPWVIISNHGGSDGSDAGFALYSEVAGYVDRVRIQYRGSADAQAVTATGLYIYGLMNQTAGGDPGTWSTRTGSQKIGGSFPYYNATGDLTADGATGTYYASIDVGSTTANTAFLRLSLPMSGSIRLRNFNFNGNNWGPFAIDDASFYINTATLRNL